MDILFWEKIVKFCVQSYYMMPLEMQNSDISNFVCIPLLGMAVKLVVCLHANPFLNNKLDKC